MTGCIPRIRSLAAVCVVAPLMVGVFGCADGRPSRDEVLSDLAETHVVPSYEQLALRTADLREVTDGLCEQPTADRADAAASAVAAIREAWSRLESVWIGPVTDRRSWAIIDWPVDGERVEELLADRSTELSADRIANRVSASVRGLGTYEYLLGGADRSIDRFDDPRRCEYLSAVATTIEDEADGVRAAWVESHEEGEAFRGTFVDDADGSVDALVNDVVFLLESITDLELGPALGVTRPDVDPDAIEEGPLGLGIDDLAHHLDGVAAVLVGGRSGGAGLSPLFSEDLTLALTDGLADANASLDRLSAPLRTAVTDQPDEVVAVRDALKVVQVLVSTEVVSELGVTVGFSDADGDTGA